MLNFANSTLNEDKENTPDAPGARPAPAPDGGSEVTPLFTAADRGPSGDSAEQDHQPVVSDQAVREQVQRVRLDLLARETERLDRRLAQILDQQREDRQLRERLQSEVGNLCQRVDQLIGAAESEPAGGSSGADLRTTVKPLLQAVLDMLDGPAQNRKPSGQGGSAQRPQGPPPSQAGRGSAATTPAAPSAPPAQAAPVSPAPRPAGARPARPAVPPAPGPARQSQPATGRVQPPTQAGIRSETQDWSAEEVEARAVALQRALSQLDQATRPAPPPHPEPPPAPRATVPQPRPQQPPEARPTVPQPRPQPPPEARPTVPQPRPQPAPAARAATPQPRPEPAPAPPRQGSAPAPAPEQRSPNPAPMEAMEDTLGAEDPTIEIAKLLRPVEARTQTNRANRRPPPAARRPADPEPLLLGTSETPEIGERAEPPSAPTAGAGGQSGTGQMSRRTGLARRASDVAASDRRAAGAQGGQDSTAAPPSGGAGKRPEPPAASTSAGLETEPLGEALPRCLTEPWDDPDPGWLQAGQDKGARRWPFRRGRSGNDAAGQRDQDRPASRGGRTRPDDGPEQPK